MPGSRLIGTLLLFLMPMSLSAQSFFADSYTERSGLPSSEVLDIAQDSRGRILVGTRNELARYDGLTWETINIDGSNSYVERSPLHLFFDSDDNIWFFGVRLLLYHFDGINWINEPREISSSYRGIHPQDAALLEIDGQHHLINIGEGIIYYFDDAQGYRSIDVVDKSGSFMPYSVIALDSAFVLGTDAGLKVLHKSKWIEHPLNRLQLPSRTVYAISSEYYTPAGSDRERLRLWLIGADWIVTVEDMKVKSVDKIPQLVDVDAPYDSRYPSTPDGFGGLFYGNKEMVYWYRGNGVVDSLTTRNSLHANGAHTLFLDREKNLWIGNDQGLTKIMGFRFFNYRIAQGLLSNDVSAIEPWTKGRIVFGHKGGLTVSSPKGFHKIWLGDDGNYDKKRVLDLQRDPDGRMWVGAERNGLYSLYDDETLHPIKLGDKEEKIISLANSDDGLLIGSEHGILLRRPSGKVEWVGVGPQNLYVRKIIPSQRHEGRYYVCAPVKGIGILEGQELHSYTNTDNSAYNNVYSAYETPASLLLLASGAGLLQFDGTQSRPFVTGERWMDEQSYLMIGQGDSLWVGTSNGVYFWDTRELRHFGLYEGLVGLETNRDAGYVDDEGKVWIGTSNGLSIYHPEYDTPLKPSFTPRILTVLADSVEMTPQSTMKLPRDHLALKIKYEFVSFRSREQTIFSQKLYSSQDSLIFDHQTDEREALFLDLEPGEYRFEVRARHGQGPWSDPAVIDSLIVSGPPLMDVLKYPLIGLITIVLVLFGVFGSRLFPGLNDLVLPRRVLPAQGLGMLVNSSGTILFVDEGLAKWLGLPAGRIAGRSIDDFVTSENQQMLLNGLREQILDHRQEVEYEIEMLTGQEGKTRSVRLRAQLVWENDHVIGQHVTILPRT